MFPDEEFLPRVPDPEDVIIEASPEDQETPDVVDSVNPEGLAPEWFKPSTFNHYLRLLLFKRELIIYGNVLQQFLLSSICVVDKKDQIRVTE